MKDKHIHFNIFGGVLYGKKSDFSSIPFETVLPENAVTRAEGLEAFEKLREQATDVPEMSLDEINAEIAEVRKNRRK